MTVPEHSHVLVDEETYWALLDEHHLVQQLLFDGVIKVDEVDALAYQSNEAERRLERSRAQNQAEPYHAVSARPTPREGPDDDTE